MTRGVFVAGSTSGTATALNDAFKPPYCIVYNSANISCATSGTAQQMTFDSEIIDNLAMHSTSVNTGRLTVPSDGAGLYHVGARVRFASNATGYRMIDIRQNGTIIAIVRMDNVGGGIQTYVECTAIANAAVADYFEVYATQTSGGALNAETSGRHGIAAWANWLSV